MLLLFIPVTNEEIDSEEGNELGSYIVCWKPRVPVFEVRYGGSLVKLSCNVHHTTNVLIPEAKVQFCIENEDRRLTRKC